MYEQPQSLNIQNKNYDEIKLEHSKLNSKRDDIDSFIFKNFKKTNCTHFVLKENVPELCNCGRTEGEHVEAKKDDKKYDVKTDIKLIPTDCYGEMKLSGFRSIAGKHPKFIRAAESANLADNMYTLMTDYWNISKPELIISINGGAKKMHPLSMAAKSAFKTGIIKLAQNAPTWIITGGFNFGVPKLVGEANYDYMIASPEKAFTVIGIGSWGAVYNREQLKKGTCTYKNSKGNVVVKGQAPLDPYHDVFLLYDGNRHREFGQEIEFRSIFEKKVSNRAECSVVQVVVEGGKKTILTGAGALKSNIPLVVMKGSKRASDVICDVVESPTIEIAKATAISLLDEYKEEWSIKTEKEKQELVNELMFIKDQADTKDMVKIFSMVEFNKNLDKAILEAAFSAISDNEHAEIHKLKLSMIYNRADIAEEVIFERAHLNLLDHQDQIFIALQKDQWRFMQLFLNHGLTVESFLTMSLLEKLYDRKEMRKSLSLNVYNIFSHLIGNSGKNRMELVGSVIHKMTNAVIPVKYTTNDKAGGCCTNTVHPDEKFRYPDVVSDSDKHIEPIKVEKQKKNKNGGAICCGGGGCTNCCDGSNKYTKEYFYTHYPPVNMNNEYILTEQDLFFWALLTQRMEMAKIFWENGKDHIGSALVASVVCKNLSSIARREGEVEMMNNLSNYQKQFEELAINILSEAYWRDKVRTHLLLIRALPYMDRTSCMDIADKNQIVDFLFHSACQTRLNAIWLGGMSPYLSLVRLVLNLPFAFFTTMWLLFPSGTASSKSINLEESQSGFEIQNAAQMIEESNARFIAEKIKDKKKQKDYLTKFRSRQIDAWKQITYCNAVSTYYRAPVTKFLMNLISYFTFLCLYAYFILVELKPYLQTKSAYDRIIEYMVYSYIATFIIEEIRQFLGSQFNTFIARLIEWVSSLWNIFDLTLYVLFIIALVLRHITTVDFVYARTIFAIIFAMYCFRCMQFYYAHQSLGPKVIMITRMMKDIGFFLAIYIIAVFAYGTFAQALLFPNQPINGLLLKNIVYMPYWQTYGELSLEFVEGSNPQNGVDATPNAIVIVGFALFMLFSNVLLLNLLIAMFGNTFAKVEENSNRIWAFNRYRLIEEFYYRPILPPPINIFEIFYHLLAKVKCTNVPGKKIVDEFLVNLYHDEDLQSSGFEQQCMETYLQENPLFEMESSQKSSDKAFLAIGMHHETTQSSQKLVAVRSEEDDKVMVTKFNEIKDELAEISEKIRKIRRHQKKLATSGSNIGGLGVSKSFSREYDETEGRTTINKL